VERVDDTLLSYTHKYISLTDVGRLPVTGWVVITDASVSCCTKILHEQTFKKQVCVVKLRCDSRGHARRTMISGLTIPENLVLKIDNLK
jgi:hypothetical protein